MSPERSIRDEDSFWGFASECDRFHEAIDEITDEIFHILFNDVGFLQNFNKLCAGYIEGTGLGEEHKTKRGALMRTKDTGMHDQQQLV